MVFTWDPRGLVKCRNDMRHGVRIFHLFIYIWNEELESNVVTNNFWGLKVAKYRNKFWDHEKQCVKYSGSHSGMGHHYSCRHLFRATTTPWVLPCTNLEALDVLSQLSSSSTCSQRRDTSPTNLSPIATHEISLDHFPPPLALHRHSNHILPVWHCLWYCPCVWFHTPWWMCIGY